MLRGVEILRLPAYASSAATLVVVGGWCTVVGLRGRPASTLGFVPLPLGTAVVWTVAVTGAGVGIMLGFRFVGGALRIRESPILADLLPRTSGERLAFAGLSLMAGLGEEVVFRGYALSVLGGATGIVWAAVLTSVAFGVLHAYQGVLGMVRTGALGGLLVSAYLAAGSLWPVVAAHALLDLLGGLVLAERLMTPGAGETEAPPGVP